MPFGMGHYADPCDRASTCTDAFFSVDVGDNNTVLLVGHVLFGYGVGVLKENQDKVSFSCCKSVHRLAGGCQCLCLSSS